ncbi:hypothetical protein DCC35_01315 [Mangrovivirga cuniculi]|uniref:Glycosyl transferase family 28 C-terminal domain-containing protein n=1 Tax=Mangrovivirga cuniculi TaxID=2715131 RepID=A0A4D7JPW2_9BACT|nr:hypothetical protein DCC35_01315 [Mangrovivirga cuniculi]
MLSKVKTDHEWHIFSKHAKQPFSVDNIKIEPVNNQKFIHSLASSKGILCGAGFESVAEAFFLGKKVMAIPMKGQYEQALNGAGIKDMGHQVIKSFKKKRVPAIEAWINCPAPSRVNYPDNAYTVVNDVMRYAKKHFIKNAESPLSATPHHISQPV